MTMRIAILGAGNVGGALARGLVRAGFPVRFGVPEPDRHRATAAAIGPEVGVGRVDEALDGAELAILAVPYGAALEIAASRDDWRGSILVDATNPLAPGLSGLLVGTTTSGAEEIARRARNARVVKAFNTTGAENLGDPRYPGGHLFLPVAGDDAEARQRVVALATAMGFDAVDLGPLAAARYLEPAAMVWIAMALKLGHGRQFGFIRERRPPP
jgi:predicted dinucleotide-binding enzyme